MTEPAQSPAEILARANVANIAAKLKAGKTLTTSERKALSEYQAQPDTSLDGVWAKDLTALSKAITLSRKGIYEARARFPDTAPARHPTHLG